MWNAKQGIRLLVREILRESSDPLGADLIDPEYEFPVEVPPGSENTLRLLQKALGVSQTGVYDYQTEKAWDELTVRSGKVKDADIEGATTLDIARDWEINAPRIRKLFGKSRSYTPGLRGMLKFVLDVADHSNEEPDPATTPEPCTGSYCVIPSGQISPTTADVLKPVPDRDTVPDDPVKKKKKKWSDKEVVRSFKDIEPGERIRGGPNFDRIKDDNNNYRAALGDSKVEHSVQFFQDLYDVYKIRRVVTLNADDGGNKLKGLIQQVVPAPGDVPMEHVYIPSSKESMPDSKEWARIKAALGQGSTIVHCARGADRTGGVVGRWYVETGLMSVEEAIENMRKHKWHEPYDEIKDFVRYGPEDAR